MFLKILNSSSNLILPVLIWQTYWLSNKYANNVLNFLIVFVFLFAILGLVGLQYCDEEKKLELKVNRRKYNFNNKYWKAFLYGLDILIIGTLVAFGSYFNGVLLSIALICIHLYAEELKKV